MSFNMSFGERLRISRMRSDLSQLEASKRLNISNNSLSAYERDSRDPDTNILKAMSELYNVSTDFLLGLTNYPDKATYEIRSKLDSIFDDAIMEVTNEDESSIYLDESQLDEETLKLVKRALKNGIKFVDEMKRENE